MSKSPISFGEGQAKVFFVAGHPFSAGGTPVPSAIALTAVDAESPDKIVLPGQHNPTREFAEFCKTTLKISDEQLVFTEDTEPYLISNDATLDGAATALGYEEKQDDEPETPVASDAPVLHDAAQSILVTAEEVDAVTPVLVLLQPLQSLKPFAAKLGYQVFGDSVTGLSSTTSAILYPKISAADQPSIAETIDSTIKRPFGFVCTTTEELQEAYTQICIHSGSDDRKATLVPCRGLAGAVEVLSTQSLNLYDFPYGQVVLQEPADLFQRERLPTYLPWLSGKLLEPVDGTLEDGQFMSFELSSASDEGKKQMSAWAAKLLEESKLDYSGSGFFEFKWKNNTPYLVAIQSVLTEIHVAAMYVQKHVKSDTLPHFQVWRHTADSSVDVWSFWARATENKVNLKPDRPTKRGGVFPLMFLKGEASMFVTVAADPEAGHAITLKARGLLDEVVEESELEHVAFDETSRRIWCNGPRPEYRRVTQRFNLCNRTLGLLRPHKDFILLPGGHQPTLEFASFMKRTMGYDDDQIIFTSGKEYNLDDDISSDEEVLGQIKQILATNPKDEFMLVPYAVTENFERWANQLTQFNVKVFGDNREWVEKLGHKGILHPHISKPEIPAVIDGLVDGIPTAKGWTCSTTEDLVAAYREMKCPDVVIKPVFGAAGEGIIFVHSEAELLSYDFYMGDVILEEFLNLDKIDGTVLSPAIQYLGPNLVSGGLVDQIMVGTSYMGWRKSLVNKSFQSIVKSYTKKLIAAMKPLGGGGFDFLSVEGEAFLTDVNTGRFNGSHFPKLFRELYAPKEASWFCWKFKPKKLHVDDFWGRLEGADIAFLPGKEYGVFPLQYLRGLSGMYIAIGKNDAHCQQLYEKAKICLKEITPIDRAPVVAAPAQSIMKLTLIKQLCTLYSPDVSSYKNVLIGGGKIVGLLDDTQVPPMEALISSAGGAIIDGSSMIATPGFVDIHEHLAGGGGELGPASRTPQAEISQIIDGGVTTAIGITGTDSIGRSPEALLSIVRGLEALGLTAYMWTGAYHLPAVTITDSVMKDVMMVEQIIGVGEVAVSDFRGSADAQELAKLGSTTYTGGLLAGKSGVVYCHMGKGKTLLKPLFDAVEMADLNPRAFLPTHVGRTPQLLEDAIKWINFGGFVDLTATASHGTLGNLCKLYARGVNLGRVIVSSDAYGSISKFDDAGNPISYTCGSPSTLHELMKELFFSRQWPLERILPMITKTPANFLKLRGKGSIAVGEDADIVLMDSTSLDIQYVFCKGKLMKGPGMVVKGTFDK